jgi:hypothetical protein
MHYFVGFHMYRVEAMHLAEGNTRLRVYSDDELKTEVVWESFIPYEHVISVGRHNVLFHESTEDSVYETEEVESLRKAFSEACNNVGKVVK